MRIRSRLMPEMQQLSQKAYDRLVAELQDLTTRGRIDIARKIEAAREYTRRYEKIF